MSEGEGFWSCCVRRTWRGWLDVCEAAGLETEDSRSVIHAYDYETIVHFSSVDH